MKYHIQTGGQSLHAQEIDFNDITTLQALYAIYDNCNSHTNALTGHHHPGESSVRRPSPSSSSSTGSWVGQEREPLQGSFILENSPISSKRP